jgi:hypothetical protein
MTVAGPDDRSLGELFSRLGNELGTLIRQEMRLAQTEMSQKATSYGRGAAMLAVGGVVLYAGLLALLATVVIILAAAGLPWWLSALIVSVVVLIAGGVLVQQGLERLRRTSLTPKHTVESIKEDVEWAKEQAR